jgi:hypothetical protein
MKLTFLDMGLAIDTYINSRERTIREQQATIQELPTPVLPFREGMLLVPIIGLIDSLRARQLTEQLLGNARADEIIDPAKANLWHWGDLRSLQRFRGLRLPTPGPEEVLEPFNARDILLFAVSVADSHCLGGIVQAVVGASKDAADKTNIERDWQTAIWCTRYFPPPREVFSKYWCCPQSAMSVFAEGFQTADLCAVLV